MQGGTEGFGYWPLSGRAEQTVGSDGCPPLPGQRFAAKSRSCKVAVSTKVQQREWYHGCPVVGTLQALVSQGFRLERREPFRMYALWQQARPLRHGLRRATSLKVRGLGSTVKFLVLPRAPPLRKDFPRSGGRCRISGKRGNLSNECETERARMLKKA